jgi:hypothetical protein
VTPVLAAFRGVVFTKDGGIRYVSDVLDYETQEALRSMGEFEPHEIGMVKLVVGPPVDGKAPYVWLAMHMVATTARREGWYVKEPPDGETWRSGMWNGLGEWMKFGAEDELPPEERDDLWYPNDI